MIEFSSSLKLSEIHMVDNPFNEDSKNIIFFQGGHNFGEGRPKNFGKMGNNRDIYCNANGGWSISKENISPYPGPWFQNPCDASIFLHARSNFRKKVKKLNFQAKFLPLSWVLPSQNTKTYSKMFYMAKRPWL